MALPKEPRQQMINMMYLVLIALLAMNVSSSLLKAFALVDESLSKAKNVQDAKVSSSFESIEYAHQLDPAKESIKEVYDAAVAARTVADKVKVKLETLKERIVTLAGGYEDQGHGIPELKQASNQDFAMQVMDFENEGPELRALLNECRKEWLNIIAPFGGDSSVVSIFDAIPEKVRNNEGTQPWHVGLFNGMPAAAVLPTLTQFENDVRAGEVEVLNFLRSQIGIAELRVDRVAPMVASETNYLPPNSDYKSEIFISAWNSTKVPKVYVGNIKPEIKQKYGKTDSISGNMKYEKIAVSKDSDFWPLVEKVDSPLRVNDFGRGEYVFNVGKSKGEKTYEGAIRMQLPTGDYEWYLFEKTYRVAPEADPVISPTAMNVFYIGIDNPVSVSVPGYQPDDIHVSISQGTMRNLGAGQYLARVNTYGKAQVDVTVKDRNGKKKKMQGMEFRVKRIPDPAPMLGCRHHPGSIAVRTFKVERGLCLVLEDFEFDTRFEVLEFDLLVIPKREDPAQFLGNKGAAYSDEIMSFIRSSKKIRAGTTVVFDNIKGKGPDGNTRNLGSATYVLN